MVKANNKETIKVPHYRSFMRGIHWCQVDSTQIGQVTLKTFPSHGINVICPLGTKWLIQWGSLTLASAICYRRPQSYIYIYHQSHLLSIHHATSYINFQLVCMMEVCHIYFLHRNYSSEKRDEFGLLHLTYTSETDLSWAIHWATISLILEN